MYVFRTVLCLAVLSAFRANAAEPDLVAHWAFEEGTGERLGDAKGQAPPLS